MLKKKQFFKLLVFLSGIGILTWQVWNTFEAFIDGQTTFAVSKETMESMTPSTMIFCPMNDFENGLNTQNNINVSDKEEFFEQFFRLDDGLNITITRWIYNAESGRFEYVMSNLTIGENFDSKSKTFLVEELFNKLFGLCYALTPDESFKMSIKDVVTIKLHFEQETEIPSTDVLFTSSEDLYSFLFFDLGLATGYRIHLQAGTTIAVQYQSSIWNYMSSKRDCIHYDENDLYTHCILKKQLDCFQMEGPNQGCNCVPYNTHKNHFDMYPLNSSWNTCQSNIEYIYCSMVMDNCYEMVRDSCLKSCNGKFYKGQNLKVNGLKGEVKANSMKMLMKFSTMDIAIYDEVMILELYNFIGTVGGSLGLFIGFSYTGFIGQIFDYFMPGN